MKSHPVGPGALAEVLSEDPLQTPDWLTDIKQHPDLYYVEHCMVCRSLGVLPLSERAWRMACRSSS